jgi:hypothetical protein
VKSDLEGPKGEEYYFYRLLELHKETSSLKYDNLDFTIIQFSDSIIISAPYDIENFHSFSKLVAEYQLKLLLNGIAIRGGITFGKHYYKDDFLFSSALIDAYHLESKIARFPRIVISEDLMDLLLNPAKANLEYIISDNKFKVIDFFNKAELSEDKFKSINEFISDMEDNKNDTISEKGLWLKEYMSHKFPKESNDYRRFSK